jgi:DNA-binding transcriptional ArsR family regulator
MHIWLYCRLAMDMANRSMLDSKFAALSNPTRRAIVARLATGDATVGELVQPFGLTQPTISKHLKVLERAGLIEGGRDAQRRPRRLKSLALKTLDDWLEPFRHEWESRFDNLQRHVTSKKED